LKILGIIPARGGSKTVPGKNGRLLAGKPLLEYTIAAALEATLLTRVVVSTDAADLQLLAKTLGAEAPFLRPAALATDEAPTLPVVQHVLQWLHTHEQAEFEAVCLLQPTCPFRAPGFIDQTIRHWTDSGCDSLVSVLPIPTHHHPFWAWIPNASGHLEPAVGALRASRRQDLSPAYFRDGSVYLTRTSVVLDGNSLYGASTAYFVSNPADYCNIDTMEDWFEAEKKALSRL
jgi:CMP-N,N'-diacetyllegionaminic acid synthase